MLLKGMDIVAAVVVLTGVAHGADDFVLKTDRERTGYAVGAQIGALFVKKTAGHLLQRIPASLFGRCSVYDVRPDDRERSCCAPRVLRAHVT